MPKSLRNKIKHLWYKGEFNDREKDRLLAALDYTEFNEVKPELDEGMREPTNQERKSVTLYINKISKHASDFSDFWEVIEDEE